MYVLVSRETVMNTDVCLYYSITTKLLHVHLSRLPEPSSADKAVPMTGLSNNGAVICE